MNEKYFNYLVLGLVFISISLTIILNIYQSKEIEILKQYIENNSREFGSGMENNNSDSITNQINIENWRKLKEKMTIKEVDSVLGTPSRIYGGNNSQTFSYFYSDAGIGFVYFDENDLVERWDEPKINRNSK